MKGAKLKIRDRVEEYVKCGNKYLNIVNEDDLKIQRSGAFVEKIKTQKTGAVWIRILEKEIEDVNIRLWVASIIWWDLGKDEEYYKAFDGETLNEYIKDFNPDLYADNTIVRYNKSRKYKNSDLIEGLEKVGYIDAKRRVSLLSEGGHAKVIFTNRRY